MLVNWLRDKDAGSISEQRERKLIDEMPGNYPDSREEKVKDDIENGVWRLSFPTYGQTPGGRVVKYYLSGRLGDRKDLSMEEKVDIYAADRKQFKSILNRYLSFGGIIVCDRYREANLIHQLVGFEGEEWEKKLEYIKSVDSDLPDADKIFYLDISPEEAARRMSDKDKDIHELDQKYMRKSNENGYKVANYESWSIIDGERTPQDVFRDLKSGVNQIV